MTARLMAIGWPAFLAACLLELLVFAVVDPMDLVWSGQPLAWSRQGVYSTAFFAFWAVCTLACALTSWLRLPPQESAAIQPRQ